MVYEVWDPQYRPRSIGEETECWSGRMDEMGTGTPLLYTYPGRITVGQVLVDSSLNCVYKPTAPRMPR